MVKEHKHKWVQKVKLVTREGFFNKLFNQRYGANIVECECGEWYYITVGANPKWPSLLSDKKEKSK